MGLEPLDIHTTARTGYHRQVVSFQSPRGAARSVSCNACNMREICIPMGLQHDELERLSSLIAVRKRVKKGAALYRDGEEFTSLYAIRTGVFKTVVNAVDGHEQVTGFHMASDMMGLDGLDKHQHCSDAIALEDSEVCVVPFGQLENLSHDLPAFQHQLHRMMSREIVREHNTMLLLGSMRADAKLAAFLLDLIRRLKRRGYSSHQLVLRMTREEMGSYLGLKLETVSRMFSRFVEDGLIEVKLRDVRILKPDALEAIVHTHH
jgi:CRP/FNR family transcriptional regulator